VLYVIENTTKRYAIIIDKTLCVCVVNIFRQMCVTTWLFWRMPVENDSLSIHTSPEVSAFIELATI